MTVKLGMFYYRLMIRSANERRGGCGWRPVRRRADARSGTPESRSQLFRIARLGRRGPQPRDVLRLALQELRSGEWVTERGRPGPHTTTAPAAATPRACNHSKSWGPI
jgi:hypothetical protein